MYNIRTLLHITTLGSILTSLLMSEAEMKTIDKAVKACDINYRGNKTITIYLDDDDCHLENLLNAIKQQSGTGHCLTIKLDEGKANKNQFFQFDGDGMDRIYEIEVN